MKKKDIVGKNYPDKEKERGKSLVTPKRLEKKFLEGKGGLGEKKTARAG